MNNQDFSAKQQKVKKSRLAPAEDITDSSPQRGSSASPTHGYEQSDFGLRVVYQNGSTSVINEELCQTPLGSAAVASARLYALTNLLTGTGWDAFDELHGNDQACVLELIHGLAAEAAALTRLAETIEIDSFVRQRATAEASHV